LFIYSDIIADVQQILYELSTSSTKPFKVTRAIPWILEAIPLNVNKGEGLLRLCQTLGTVSPDQVLAFGDGENDIDMFKVVGHPVAMANAMPAALATAKYTADSNDEGGVGAFIEKIWGL